MQLFRTHVPRTSHYRTPNANLTSAVSLCSLGCIWLTFLEPEHSKKKNTSNGSLLWLRDGSTVLTIWWIVGKDWDEPNLHAWYSLPVPNIFFLFYCRLFSVSSPKNLSSCLVSLKTSCERERELPFAINFVTQNLGNIGRGLMITYLVTDEKVY